MTDIKRETRSVRGDLFDAGSDSSILLCGLVQAATEWCGDQLDGFFRCEWIGALEYCRNSHSSHGPACVAALHDPFVRLLIAFHFLRQALGTQTTPSNQTLIGLALILTFFLMQPVGVSVYDTALQPFQEGRVDAMQAIQLAAGPSAVT